MKFIKTHEGEYINLDLFKRCYVHLDRIPGEKKEFYSVCISNCTTNDKDIFYLSDSYDTRKEAQECLDELMKNCFGEK